MPRLDRYQRARVERRCRAAAWPRTTDPNTARRRDAAPSLNSGFKRLQCRDDLALFRAGLLLVSRSIIDRSASRMTSLALLVAAGRNLAPDKLLQGPM